ncbi:MAG TPA: hypothetical protein VLB74_00335 [Flavobacterium sp.]|uniref:hypothetical protein n=1 Tax=Flavobacterium sp. TaxID=239 RepID=UPI002C0218FC|nr:hypothetical protein [Flavobacterium sp.]HSD13072.1 hypothetical protein [Flavobacterium sp.]
MIKEKSIFSVLCFSLLLLSCKKEIAETKLDYNQKANELIQQIILDESCGCILEIPKESISKINAAENPLSNIGEKIIIDLGLKNQKELDSLENISKNFDLDSSFLEQNSVVVFKRNTIKEISKDNNILKKCPNGIQYFLKPIFNKKYDKAYIRYGEAFMCLSTPGATYKFENDRW